MASSLPKLLSINTFLFLIHWPSVVDIILLPNSTLFDACFEAVGHIGLAADDIVGDGEVYTKSACAMSSEVQDSRSSEKSSMLKTIIDDYFFQVMIANY